MRNLVRLIASTMLVNMVGCASPHEPDTVAPTRRGSVTLVRPRCAGVKSCLLGHVVSAESAMPMPRAAVFLERERSEAKKADAKDSSKSKAIRILTLTDDQGIFTVVDAPPGRYRLAIYKDARRVEVRGIKLGAPGTTMVPVRLPRG